MENKILEEFTGLTLKMITCINSPLFMYVFFSLFCFMTYCVFDSACEVVFFASVTRALLLS